MSYDPPLLPTPERIAFAGDWHADLNWARRAVTHAAARDASVIVHLGDFGYNFYPHYLSHLEQELALAGLHLMFVEGNHEDHRWLARQRIGRNGLRMLTDHIWHVPRGFRWTWGGVQFLGLGGAHSVDGMWRRQGGLLWQKEERLTDEDIALAQSGGRADVLVAHDCPHGVDIPGLHPDDFPPIEVLRGEEHRQLVRQVVDVVQPRLIWHGHYHVRYDATPDFGYGPVQVEGLASNDDGDVAANVHVVALKDLAENTVLEESAP